MADNMITYELKERLGTIAHYETGGWSKQLNIIAWNEGTAKYDIRDWSPDNEHMSKGITLHESEARMLMELLIKHFEEVSK